MTRTNLEVQLRPSSYCRLTLRGSRAIGQIALVAIGGFVRKPFVHAAPICVVNPWDQRQRAVLGSPRRSLKAQLLMKRVPAEIESPQFHWCPIFVRSAFAEWQI